MHDGCPDVEETMKWSFPHFDYKGMMCSMAAFKEHCAFGFWKASLILDGNGRSDEAMGQFGRITRALGPAVEKIDARVHPAGDGAQRQRNDGPARAQGTEEADSGARRFQGRAVKKNKKALAAFEAFSPSHRREYLEWITEAKSDDTRAAPHRTGDRVDGGGQVEKLEIRAEEAGEITSARD